MTSRYRENIISNMIKGYITLKQASEISGKEVEALKKQCQTGRIRGAIKQGKTWFVPQGEIIVDDNTTGNGTLNFLVSLVELSRSDEKNSVSFGVSILVNGTFIQGDLVSKSEYLQHFRNSMLTKISFGGEAAKNDFTDKFNDFTNKYFNALQEKDEDGIPSFIHLRNISSGQIAGMDTIEGSYIRIKTSSIDGFMLGVTRRSDERS